LSRMSNEEDMAFSKSRVGSKEECKSLIDMASEPSSGLSSIVESGLSDDGDHKIMNRGQDLSGMTDGHTGSVFFEGHITAVM